MTYESFISEFYFGTFHFSINNVLLFQRTLGYDCWIDLKVSIDFHKNNVFQLSHGIKNIYPNKL